MIREFVYFKDNINIFEVNNLCWFLFREKYVYIVYIYRL